MSIKTLYHKIQFLLKINALYNLYRELAMKDFFRSKKVKALILGTVTILLVNLLGMPEEQAAKITEAIQILFGIFVGGQSIADGLSRGKTSSVSNGD